MVTKLEIIQDNKAGDCDALAVHSPLVFFVRATYTGAVPEYIQVDILDRIFPLGTYKARLYSVGDYAIYKFQANKFLLAQLSTLQDINPVSNIWTPVTGRSMKLLLSFKDLNSNTEVATTIEPFHCAVQTGENQAVTKIYNNEPNKYLCKSGEYVYMYIWASAGSVVSDGNINSGITQDYDSTDFVDDDGTGFVIDKLI